MEWLERLGKTERQAIDEMVELIVSNAPSHSAVWAIVLLSVANRHGITTVEISDYIWSVVDERRGVPATA
jgi:hypothetical protein